MALIGNYSVLNKSAAQFTNGAATAGAYAAVTPSNYQNNGMKVNRFGGKFADHSAIPSGYIPPYSFALPKISGGLAAYKGLSAEISTTDALLALGINIDASLSANMTKTDAILALIVALEVSITASGSITDANMAIIILLEAALSATGQFTNAELKNILNLAASLAATGALTNSITNLVNLSADISNASGGITNESIAASVWSALAADNDSVGTMGELLNNSGGGSSPSDIALEVFDNQDVETGLSLREALRIVLAALGGKVSGAGTSTITIRNAIDNKDRIIATVDSNGNRTAVTLDVT